MISLPTTGIDRSSPVPFWFQLARVLEQAIASGLWRPGERLASESELCDHFGISRTTVRQALARLEQEGMVVRRKGFGTFATSAGPRMWLVQSQEGFYHDEVFRLGRAVSSQMLRRELTELRLPVATGRRVEAENTVLRAPPVTAEPHARASQSHKRAEALRRGIASAAHREREMPGWSHSSVQGQPCARRAATGRSRSRLLEDAGQLS